MSYCTNCGATLKNKTKFCTACGKEVVTPKESSVKTKRGKQDKEVVKSLIDEKPNFIKIKKPLSEFGEENRTADTKKPSKKLIYIYLTLSIILLMFGGTSDEIMGVQIFSLIILVGYAIRHKKVKPFNWLLKIVMILQLVLLFSVFMTQAEYFFYNLHFLGRGCSLLGLFIVIILLLIRGNKT